MSTLFCENHSITKRTHPLTPSLAKRRGAKQYLKVPLFFGTAIPMGKRGI